jgi:putative ABC transport system permease protein
MGTRILRGRAFTDDDREGSALVAIVSESMAKAPWPGRDAMGQCMHVMKPDAACTTVVGIAEDVVQQADQLTDSRKFSYYLPMAQNSGGQTYMVLRMRQDAETQSDRVRRSLQPAMPGPAYVTVRSFAAIIGNAQRAWRLGANLFVIFGALALVVAAIGLYGVMAYNVTQRMHELGVRVALGAQARDILGLIVGQGTRFALIGVVVGSVLSLFASKWVQPLLFQQSARDPMVYGRVGAMMLLVAIAACASPARRAAGADPNAALRSE